VEAVVLTAFVFTVLSVFAIVLFIPYRADEYLNGESAKAM
jgi:multisubunit Na+/H+ antiporter MnhC subunit